MTAEPHLVAQATDHLLRTAYAMREGDQHEPSLCAGWTRGHVLTHLARNADGLTRLVRAAVDGTGETMYASTAAREADIAAGAGRSLAELIADLETTAEALAPQLTRLTPEHASTRVERTPGGVTFTARHLPFMRLREVSYHHVDLDAGFTFADLSPSLVTTFLTDEVRRLREAPLAPEIELSTDEGDLFELPGHTAYVSGSRAALLGWLARGLSEGVRCDGPLPTLPAGG